MRFHGLMLIRDEADIITESLTHALQWADTVTVFDTGSTDGTWEIISAMADKDSRINAFEHSPVVYGNPLRAYIFDRVRATFDEGDWVVKLDADEFFHVPPSEFVTRFLRKSEACVWLQWYFFRLTTQEVADYESGKVSLAEDRLKPIADRRRFYKIPLHSEPRMFRYRKMMRWSADESNPHHSGFIARERIPIRHYPHRDPIQMEARYKLRALMKQIGSSAGPHWRGGDWRNDLVIYGGDLASAHEITGNQGLHSVQEHTSGSLMYWAPNTGLPRVQYCNHLDAPPRRLLRYEFNRYLLPVADRIKDGFAPEWRPKPIKPDYSLATVAKSKGRRRRSVVSRPGFHGLLVLRDEGDIISQTLTHLLEWADSISVLDLGSTDETWEIVQDMARHDHRVIPVERSSYVFGDSVRGYLFDRCRGRFRNGDWIIRVDGDEFYHLPPPDFVRKYVKPFENSVHLNWYYFRLTSREVEDYATGRLDVVKDRLRPIQDRRRFYKIPDYTEPRMFRYRPSIKWSPNGSFPYNVGPVARSCIPIRHYPHRDPLQMEARYKLRAAMMRLKDKAEFPQWAVEDWKKDVLVWDTVNLKWIEPTGPAEGLRAASGHAHGEVHEWQQGTDLPILGVEVPRLVYAAWKRLILKYPFVNLADSLRQGWPMGHCPRPMPTE
jgi:glycosyltransferase involved in cell wall biosynthesis